MSESRILPAGEEDLTTTALQKNYTALDLTPKLLSQKNHCLTTWASMKVSVEDTNGPQRNH